jgi:hypothetical protein
MILVENVSIAESKTASQENIAVETLLRAGRVVSSSTFLGHNS